jgi:putative hydrolase of the HAD superfamily
VRHEVGLSKPDPRIYALACGRLSVHPSQAAFIDDDAGHCAGARRAGLHAVQYRDNTQTIGEIGQLLAAP